MTTALLVVAHPRADSLTARVAGRAGERLVAAGHRVDVLDLHAEGFDPRMTSADEPDWSDPGKTYSPGTREHMRRLDAADAIVVVFPVWWFGLPAILKGWVDRVWNYGFAYGGGRSRLAGKRMAWIGLAGYPRDHFTEAGWDRSVERHLRDGIARFCDIEDVSVHLVYDTVSGRPHTEHIAAAEAGLDALLG
ncbi:NAD(P)H oxidoreductase [Actinomadura algeriensis]|uniref:NADPH-quinone reductase n=1 Tax=Actinomadura algeriensis TaxID=1679523 RepID=A0ABR9JJI8_9ACTN|nr:NAD(P)H oxidoreductase [Actinomadura algeriensis]MBE1530723.1 putative NADPH-quinone reductase [Actinomadura algeriensis]